MQNRGRSGIYNQHRHKPELKLQVALPFKTADCRLETGQVCILLRLQDAGVDFGAIYLWVGMLGP
jgi:hypothetical protein